MANLFLYIRIKIGGSKMGKLFVFDHPLIQHKLTLLRDVRTKANQFRALLDEIGTLMAYEITRDLPLESYRVQTPVESCSGQRIADTICIVPILRAGLGMVNGILGMLPSAQVGHIGLARDESSLQPTEYYVKLPEGLSDKQIIVVDPMLATGGSAIAALEMLKRAGAKKIKLMSLIAVQEGIQAVQSAHPDIDIFVAAVDPVLNEHGYIVPGLGDAGDRLFNLH
jgi:uracil phosphoribosyltransferase